MIVFIKIGRHGLMNVRGNCEISDYIRDSLFLDFLASHGCETTVSNGNEYFESSQKLEKLSDVQVQNIGD